MTSSSRAVSTNRMDQALARLRSAGDRVTVGKRAVLGVLIDRDEHLTVEDVFADAATRAEGMHLSTVYRTLESFVALGLVTRVAVGKGAAVYHLSDTMTGHHHAHGHCTSCGLVIDLPADLLDDIGKRTVAELGFVLDRHNVALTGLCSDCASR
jgi:Fur family ferric uptake transcriptional regulator